MKRFFLIAMMAVLAVAAAQAGGLMTNTNYHGAFNRMMARGASHEIDAIYSNPAGLAWGHEGWQLSFNWQGPTQNRDIDATFAYGQNVGGQPLLYNKKYNGKASAPFVPALFAAYKHDRWALGAMIGIVGSGGFVKYDEGLPMFDQPLMSLLYAKTSGVLTPDYYTTDSQVKGKQYIYGGQVNFTYRFNDHLSAAVGFRANYYDGYYRGHVIAQLNPGVGTAMARAKAASMDAMFMADALAQKLEQAELVNLQLDCDQKGWGFNPVIGINYRYNKLTLAAKYEFRAKLNIPNKTNALGATILDPSTLQPMDAATTMALLGDKLAAYQDGTKTRYDMPALLTVAAGYEFTPRLRATVEYHFFDDKNAKMAGDRQKELTRGTHEILAGVEYDINKTFTVSAGGQRTDYGLSDGYQSNTSFACDSYSVGLGTAINLNDHLRFNLTYFWTMYSDYTKQTATGAEIYSRTNGVFGVGVDYKF